MDTNLRKVHKEALKTILETITYTDLFDTGETVSMAGKVFDRLVTLTDQDMAVCVMSGGVFQEDEDSCHVQRTYTYQIEVSLEIKTETDQPVSNDDIIRETEMDEIENKIMELINQRSTRYALIPASNNYQLDDVTITEVSSPYSSGGVESDNSHVSKTFTVDVQMTLHYD